MLDALSTVGNKSELLWFCGKGSPAGADCGHLALALGCSTGSRSLGAPYPAPSSTLPSRVGGAGEGGREWRKPLPCSLTDLGSQAVAPETLSE